MDDQTPRDELGRTFEGLLRMAAKGACPHCCYSFNGVLDELCDNEQCPEHLRDRIEQLEKAIRECEGDGGCRAAKLLKET